MSEWQGGHPPEEWLHEYLDRELDGQTQVEVAEHITECSRCQRQLAEVQELFRVIESIPALPVERDISPQVAGALDRRLHADGGLRWMAVFQAGLILMMFLAVSFYRVPIERMFRGLLVLILVPRDWIIVNIEAVSFDLGGISRELTRGLQGIPPLGEIQISTPLNTQTLMILALLILVLWAAGNTFLLRTPVNGQRG